MELGNGILVGLMITLEVKCLDIYIYPLVN
jgi:hypothetical protein